MEKIHLTRNRLGNSWNKIQASTANLPHSQCQTPSQDVSESSQKQQTISGWERSSDIGQLGRNRFPYPMAEEVSSRKRCPSTSSNGRIYVLFPGADRHSLGGSSVDFLSRTDATFNTNGLNMLPSILLGVTNAMSSFPVAYIFISSESAEAFKFILVVGVVTSWDGVLSKGSDSGPIDIALTILDRQSSWMFRPEAVCSTDKGVR